MAPLYPKPQSHRVIQVVDCLSDTVVSVTQLDADTKKRFRWGLIAAAVACFLLASTSFYSAVSTASANKTAYSAHLNQGLPSHSFRPARVSSGLEWGGGLAAVIGMACMVVAFASRRRSKSQFRAQVPWSLVDDFPDFEMVAIEEGGAARLRVPPEMVAELVCEGALARGDEICELGKGIRDAEGWLELQLGDADRLMARSGQRSYRVEWTNRSNRAAVAAHTRIDSTFGAYLAASAVAALLVVVLLDNLQPEPKILFSDSMASQQRLIAIRSAPPEAPIAEPDDKTGDESGGSTTIADASEAGAAGTAGIETGTSERASLAIKKRQDAPTLTRKQVRSVAAHSGIMGTFSDRQIFASLTATSNFASGYESKDWHGGFEGGPVGHQVGELSGSYGNHIAGLGVYGTSKVGNRLPGLHYGKGPCDSDEPCVGTSHTLGLRKRVASKPTFDLGEATSNNGGLDRSIIRRHIKKKRLRIQHCYEKRLLVAPKLAGTLVASFSVGGSGKVLGSNASGIGDKALQDCVASVVASIAFPRTKDGGIVNVRYPFTFHSVGD